jgi:signal transduction histidine kinase
MPKRAAADDLAQALARANAGQRKAGRALHDDIGPLLSAAGLRLQLVRMDYPQTGERVGEVMETLDLALEKLRRMSMELSPSPVYRGGLKIAMDLRIEQAQANRAIAIRYRYTTSLRLPIETAVAIYDAADFALSQATGAGASKISISVGGSKNVWVRLADNGKVRRDYFLGQSLARHAGLKFDVFTGKGTIVRIEHALRRPSRG